MEIETASKETVHFIFHIQRSKRLQMKQNQFSYNLAMFSVGIGMSGRYLAYPISISHKYANEFFRIRFFFWLPKTEIHADYEIRK